VMGVPPRLIDLSVARTTARARRATRPIGTDAYMAPEQCDPASHPGELGPPADVFGLGATLYHALTGRRPFPRPSGARESAELTVRFPQLLGPPEPLGRRVPPPLAGVVMAALAPAPADRPAAAELATALEPLVAALPQRLVLGRR